MNPIQSAAGLHGRRGVPVNLVGAEIKHLSFDASEVLSTDPANPTRLVKGVTGTTAPRGFMLLQNNTNTTIYLIDKPKKPTAAAYQLLPTAYIMLDVFTMSGELYAYAGAAGAQLTILEGQ